MMVSLATIAYLLVLLFSAVNIVDAQQQPTPPTTSTCSCAPTNFIFRLDFNRTCDDNTVLIGKTHGIDRSFCRTDDVNGSGGDDPTVVRLTSILILELDSSLQVIKQHFRDELELSDGQMLKYASIVAGEDTAGDNTVAAIQMALTGVTAGGIEIQSQYILTYTNLCSTDVFRVGDAISWLVVDDIVPAPDDLCNAGAVPDDATSGSSSNDVPPDLVDPDHTSGGDVGMDRSAPQANGPISLSMQVLRRLDFSDWRDMLDESPDLDTTMERGPAKLNGGLDRRLRRRRFLARA
mmetsp:Transcript_1653/g.4817  ORF Transcript_1653/g.4817 Transcript_1653/m.4817 type:complete len:293 (+) Transcript_1653:671-1549(+)